MPLLLASSDVSGLLDDAATLDGLLEAVAGAYRAPHPFELAGRNIFEAPIPEGESLRIFPSVASAYGTALRIDPAFQQQRRQPDASRVVILFDAEGRLRSMMAGDLQHSLRIAAPAALAARLLAPERPRVLAVLGSGAEARAHLPVLRRALPSLEEVRVFSLTAANRDALAAEHNARSVEDARAAVEGADVVAALTSASQPVFQAEWIRPGALVVAIARGQLPGELVRSARLFVANRGMFARGGGRTVADPNRQLADAWSSAEPVGELA
ncbi:MAG: hypothetical protein JO020_31375, partial [Chloroflexi bacterium]|nr:hypothetical protein [Chloroflexota bacterium]